MDALLTRLLANPDDLDAHRVCADLLLERGDPRGELMAVQCERRLNDTRALVDREHALIWHSVNPQMTERLQMRSVSYAWRLGFLESITFSIHGDEPFDAIGKLAADPAALLLRRLVISAVQLDGEGDLAPALRALAQAASAFPLLTDVRVEEGGNLGNPWIEGPIFLGDCSPLFEGFANLEHVALHGKGHRLGTIVSPKLRTFAATDLPIAVVPDLARARWPKLTSLDLEFEGGVVERPGDVFAPLLEADFGAQLENVWVGGGGQATRDWFEHALPGSRLARHAKSVGLQRPRATTGFPAR